MAGVSNVSPSSLATNATAIVPTSSSDIHNATTVPVSLPPSGSEERIEFYTGVVLAMTSSAFIGASFILKKKGLLKVERTSGGRAGNGGYGYLREWMWWAGLLTMIFGEVMNFIAYVFASAVVVAPLGGLSVIVSAILASRLLNEHLNTLGKLGCFLCMIGASMVIVSAPDGEFVKTIQALQIQLCDPVFITFCTMITLCSIYLIWFVAPTYGSQNMLVYISICSLIGSLSVMAVKGVGLALKLTIEGDNQLKKWIVWVLFVALLVCVVIQIIYLNRALDTFNTSIVTSVYYVMFTGSTILASFILFKDWHRMHTRGTVGLLCGFSTIVVGVILLRLFQDFDEPRKPKHRHSRSLSRSRSTGDRPVGMTVHINNYSSLN